MENNVNNTVEQKEEKVEELQTFFIEVSEIKTANNKFLAYKGFVGPKQTKIDLRFRRDVKDVPTTSGYLTVKVSNTSLDERSRFPKLWIHEIESFDTKAPEQNNSKVKELFK